MTETIFPGEDSLGVYSAFLPEDVLIDGFGLSADHIV